MLEWVAAVRIIKKRLIKMNGFMCSTSVYKYEGWLFEYNPYMVGPWPLTKGGELRKRAGEKFWNMFKKWVNLTDKEQAATKIGGGCERF